MNSSFFSNLQSNMDGYGGGAAGDVASTAYGGIKKLAGLPVWLIRMLLGQGQQSQGQGQQPYGAYNPAYMSSAGVDYAPGFSPGSFNAYVNGLSGDSSPTITQPPGPPPK